MISKETILKNNRNILYNILACLNLKERYCLTNYCYFEKGFKTFLHNELIKINYHDFKLTKIWNNIMFEVDLSNIHYITNVSVLSYFHTVNLCNCQNIKDMSSLYAVHTLDLSHCKNKLIFINQKNIKIKIQGCKYSIL